MSEFYQIQKKRKMIHINSFFDRTPSVLEEGRNNLRFVISGFRFLGTDAKETMSKDKIRMALVLGEG